MLDSLQLNNKLREILLEAGPTSEVGGNTPFLLNHPGVVWMIVSGTIEVFTVRLEDGQPAGTRSHFYTAKEGELLFGMDLEKIGQNLGLLAVGVVGTRICEIPFALIQRLARTPEFAPELSGLIDNWINGLSYGITKSIYPKPRVDSFIVPGATVDLEAGQKARARKGVAWVQFLRGNSLFIGMEEVAFQSNEAIFPLNQETWIECISFTQIVVMDTLAAMERNTFWDGLESLYDVLFKCEFFNTTLATVDEYNRLQKKAERDVRVRDDSLAQIASIMYKREEAEVGPDLDDPLFAACVAVGKSAGIVFTAPPRLKDEQKRKDPLGDIVKAARVRSRSVVLNDGWWTKDNGPLLGYIEKGMQPVALLPTMKDRYLLFDPVKQTTIHVTPKVSATLAPTGVMFYRVFPGRVIQVWDLVRFGSLACELDLRRIAMMGIASGLLALVVPLSTGTIFSTVIPEAERGQLAEICLILFVSALTTALFTIVQSIAMLRVEGRMDASVNGAIMDRLLSIPVPFFRNFAAGDLAQRVLGISEIRRMLSGHILIGAVTSLFSLMNFALLFYYDWKLAIVATALTLIVISVTSFTGYLQLRYQRQIRDLEGKIMGLILQLITGISKLRAAGAEGHAFSYWANEFAAQKKLAFKARAVSNKLLVFNSVLPILSSGILFAWMAFSSKEAKLGTGDFLAFNAAFAQFLAAATILNSTVLVILGLVPIYERSQPILQALPEVDKGKAYPGELSGEIELSHVSFRYESDGPLILKDVSLRIHPGEFVAFVGPSGTGKSTLFRLLLGFEKPERGSIHFDGQDLSVLDVQAVRRQIGVVLQHSKVMTGDIFHNIIGTAPLTEDDAWEAARKAGLDEDIKNMPMGMHTIVSEGGGTFSGGQRQRLLIARSIALNPRILLFDEATSALDNRTQAIVSQSLEGLQATRIVIAHRLSTIINADRILVLDGGSIVQSGTYQELMNQEGLFIELAKRQLA